MLAQVVERGGVQQAADERNAAHLAFHRPEKNWLVAVIEQLDEEVIRHKGGEHDKSSIDLPAASCRPASRASDSLSTRRLIGTASSGSPASEASISVSLPSPSSSPSWYTRVTHGHDTDAGLELRRIHVGTNATLCHRIRIGRSLI